MAEVAALVLVALGLLYFFATGRTAPLLAAMALALILNQWNRRQSDRRSLRRILAELRQVRQELTEEQETLRTTLKRQSAGSFSQLQSSQDLELAMAQLRLQNTRLDQSLHQVVNALNELLPQPVELDPETPPVFPDQTVASPTDRSPAITPPPASSSSSSPGSPSLGTETRETPKTSASSPQLPAFPFRNDRGTPAATVEEIPWPDDTAIEEDVASNPTTVAASTSPSRPETALPPMSPMMPPDEALRSTAVDPGSGGSPTKPGMPRPPEFQTSPDQARPSSPAQADAAADPAADPPLDPATALPLPTPDPAAPSPAAIPQFWQEALSWQQGLSFVAHSGWVNAIALSRDGQRLVTGGTDQQIRIWGLPDGQLQAEWSTPSPISALAFSPDHRLLASGNYDHRIQLWDLQDERLITTLEGHYGSVKALAFFVDPVMAQVQAIAADAQPDPSPNASPDLTVGLISGSYDQTLRIWDLQRGHSDCLEGHEGSIQALALAASDCAISGGEEGHLRLWRLPDGQTLDVLTANSSAVEALALSADGTILASGCSNGNIYLWHLPSRTPCYGLEAHTGPVTALALTPDGHTLISGGADGRLKLWHVPTGKPQGNLADPIDAILNLTLSPSGDLLISSHPGGQIQLWWRQETGVA